MPAGKGLIGTRWDNVQEAKLGTSGDTATVIGTNNWGDVYYSGGAGDDVITGEETIHFIQGGVGDDTLKTREEYHRWKVVLVMTYQHQTLIKSIIQVVRVAIYLLLNHKRHLDSKCLL